MAANDDEYQLVSQVKGATAQITFVSNGKPPLPDIPVARKAPLDEAARSFLRESGGDVCVLLTGQLQSDLGDPGHSTENAVAERCLAVLGDPGGGDQGDDRTIDLVLDTLGGSLDSAYRIVLFLSQFSARLRVYVPRRAKSAGTLIAIGGHELYLGPFAELGPLDTQIPNPRNPTERVSALDCFQSVDFVRGFGLGTLKRGLVTLGKEMQTGIPLPNLMATAREFASSCTESLLAKVEVLDFGGWGRTLQIGERYTQRLLSRVGYDNEKAAAIAYQLVYGYTHHPFPIDLAEAVDIGLKARAMPPGLARHALRMVRECAGLDVAIGVWEAAKQAPVPEGGQAGTGEKPGIAGDGRGSPQGGRAGDMIQFMGDPAQEPAAIIESFREESVIESFGEESGPRD